MSAHHWQLIAPRTLRGRTLTQDMSETKGILWLHMTFPRGFEADTSVS